MDNNSNSPQPQNRSSGTASISALNPVIQPVQRLIEQVLIYTQHGWQPIPIPYRGDGSKSDGKNPGYPGWEKYRCDVSGIASSFNLEYQRRNGASIFRQAIALNAGLLLGTPSGGLIDVDLDSVSAIKAAELVLPATQMIHGRPGKPCSHYWYICREAGKTQQFRDPESGISLIELRSTGGQTIVPPSIHPSGENLAWVGMLNPASISFSSLQSAVEQVAAAAIIAARWQPGSRDALAMSLAGSLVHGGYREETALKLVKAICYVTGDDETDSRLQAVSDTYRKCGNGELVTGLPTLSKLLGDKAATALANLLCLKTRSASAATSNTPVRRDGKGSDATALFHLADTRIRRYFLDQESVAHIQLRSGEPLRSCEIQSENFKAYLRQLYFEQCGLVIGTAALSAALDQLKATAHNSGIKETVWVRMAHKDGRIYLDLANANQEVVEVDAQGWHIITDPPVVFRHNLQTLPLPQPVAGGSIHDLREFVNVADDSWPLFVSYCIGCFNHGGGLPILALYGETGSAKSTTSRVLKRLLDPTEAELRTQPDKEQVVMIAAHNDFIVAFDNLSKIETWLSDMLCVLSTGGAYTCRKLYSDKDESILRAKRLVVINGIPDLVRRPDLASRVLKIMLEPIPDDKRMRESAFWESFKQAHPRILGALLDAVVGGLRNLPHVRLERQPRMADFACWAVACEEPAGLITGSFMAAYDDNRACTSNSSLEASPVAQLFVEWAHNLTAPWEGPATEMLEAMKASPCAVHAEWLPRSPRRLADELRMYAQDFRALGIDITTRTLHGLRVWQINGSTANSPLTN